MEEDRKQSMLKLEPFNRGFAISGLMLHWIVLYCIMF